MKHPNRPDRFADSEVALHEELDRLRTLAGAPELYPDLISLNLFPPLVGFLSHDNSDIATDTVSLLSDLTDADDDLDDPAPAIALADSLIENNTLELLLQNLTRLSESDTDEANAVLKLDTLRIDQSLVPISGPYRCLSFSVNYIFTFPYYYAPALLFQDF